MQPVEGMRNELREVIWYELKCSDELLDGACEGKSRDFIVLT